MGEWRMSGNGEHNCPIYFDDNGDEWWIGELEPVHTEAHEDRSLLAESGPDEALEALIRQRDALQALVSDLAERRRVTLESGTASIVLNRKLVARLDAAATAR